MENKLEFKRRLQLEGRWGAFQEQWKALTASGVPKRKAYEEAVKQYVLPVESRRQTLVNAAKDFMAQSPEAASVLAVKLNPSRKDFEQANVGANLSAEDRASFAQELRALASNTLAVQQTQASAAERNDILLQRVAWVLRHLDDEAATLERAPSPGAWQLREFFRSDSVFLCDFLIAIWILIEELPSEGAKSGRMRLVEILKQAS